MAATTFWERLEKSVDKQNSLLCVGIDPEDCNYHKVAEMVNATYKYACCYKLNLGFFLGHEWELRKIIEAIQIYTKLPVILDGKFGDIENTAEKYASFVYRDLYVDAVTLNPYIGEDTIKPFSKYDGNGSFILTTTTNDSSEYIQNIKDESNNMWLRACDKAAILAQKYHQGCVVGRDYKKIRQYAPKSWFLCPGVGTQGKNLENIMSAQWNNGKGVIVNVSRGIFSANNPEEKAREYRDMINGYRKST